ncbi:MAG: WD40 repeat domain-containing protein [Pseudomonadota bacterium]
MKLQHLTIKGAVLGGIWLLASCGNAEPNRAQQNKTAYTEFQTTNNANVFVEPDRLEGDVVRNIDAAKVVRYRVEDAINGVAFLDETMAIAVALNKDVLLLDGASGDEQFRFEPCRSCSNVHIKRSDDGREIVMPSRARDGGGAYDLKTGAKLRDLTGPDYRAAYTPDGSHVLSVLDRQAVIESRDSAAPVWNSGVSDVGALGYAPDGSRFVIAADDGDGPLSGGKVLIYNAETRDIETRIDYARATFNHLAITPDSRRLILGSYKDRVLVWRLDEQKPHCRFNSDAKGRGLRALKLSPDGHLIATGGGTNNWGYVRVWDAETCELRAEVNFKGRVSGLSFHPTRPSLAAGAWSGELAIVDLEKLLP